MTVFSCRCGFTISTADYERFSEYELARKVHAEKCPMRDEKPWPFKTAPATSATSSEVGEDGAVGAPSTRAVGVPGVPASVERWSPTALVSRLFASAPRWVRRRTAVT